MNEEQRRAALKACRIYNTGHDLDSAWMREDHIEAMAEALDAVGYFKAMDVVEAAREFDRLCSIHNAMVSVTGASEDDVTEATARLWNAGKALTAALDALKEAQR